MTNDIKDWSTTPASNDTADPGINWQEGMAPSAVNNSGRAMMAAVKSWWDESLGGIAGYAPETGSANTYVIAPSPVIAAYATGQEFNFFAANANTGASTLNVNALGTKAVQKNGAALISGDIGAGDLVRLVYDGTQFQWQSLPLNLSLSSLGVGIAPTSPVHVKTGVGYDGMFIESTGGGDNSGAQYLMQADNTGSRQGALRYNSGSGTQIVGGGLDLVLANLSVTAGADIMLAVNGGDASEQSLRLERTFGVVSTTSTVESTATTNGALVLVGGMGVAKNISCGGALIVGSPTGGMKGAGEINAQAVYDDNALLTCYVTDMIVDGVIDQEAWDSRVPDLEIPAVTTHRRMEDGRGDPVLDEDGKETFEAVELEPARTEERTHAPAKAFALRASRSLDPDLFYADMVSRRALPAMPTRDEWLIKPPSVGTQVQALIETIETLVEHDHRQRGLIKDLVARVSILEGA